MKQRIRLFLLVSVVLSVACGGGGSEAVIGGGGGSGNLSASFTPNNANPGPNSVTLGQLSASGNLVTLRVDVTDTQSVYAAGFEIVYDAAVAEFVNWSAGSFLESGGTAVNYVVAENSAGRVVVSASRTGSSGTVDASGSQMVIQLVFRATAAGSGSFSFDLPFLQDDQLQDLAGINWQGGTLVAN